jgi:hypothetical protein
MADQRCIACGLEVLIQPSAFFTKGLVRKWHFNIGPATNHIGAMISSQRESKTNLSDLLEQASRGERSHSH